MTINLEKSLDVDASASDLFSLLSDTTTASHLLPHGQEARLEVTERTENQRISWKISGTGLAGTATVQLSPAGEDSAITRITLTAHFPNGLGASTKVPQVTADMEKGLAKLSGLVRGEVWPEPVGHLPVPQANTLQSQLASADRYPAITESAATLYQSLTTATEAWSSSVNKNFQVLSALAWMPFQAGFAYATSVGTSPRATPANLPVPQASAS